MTYITITAQRHGFHLVRDAGLVTERPEVPELFGAAGGLPGGRFHLGAATGAWLAERSFADPAGLTVMTGTDLPDLGQAGPDAGDLLRFGGIDNGALRGARMEAIGTMAISAPQIGEGLIGSTSAGWIGGEAGGQSLSVDAATSLAAIAALHGIALAGSNKSDVFDPNEAFWVARGGPLQRGVPLEGFGGADPLTGTSLRDRILGRQ